VSFGKSIKCKFFVFGHTTIISAMLLQKDEMTHVKKFKTTLVVKHLLPTTGFRSSKTIQQQENQ
jgi:hypothetical protein